MVKKLFSTFLYWQLYQKRSFYLLRISGQNFSPKWKTDNWNFSYLSKKYKIECCNQIIQGLSFNRNRDAFWFKDQIPKYVNSKVIYKFKCNIGNDVCIGETKHHFLVCDYEHLGKWILPEKNLKYTKKDAIAIRKHCHNHGHTADTSSFSLVENAANKYHLK